VKRQEKYRRIPPSVYDQGWDEATERLAIYLMLNPHGTAEGLYRLAKPTICDDLCWSMRRLNKPFEALKTCGFIDYDEQCRVVLVAWSLHVQNTANVNMRKHAIRYLRQLPATPLFTKFLEIACSYDELLARAMLDEIPEYFPPDVRRSAAEWLSQPEEFKPGPVEPERGARLLPDGSASVPTLGNHGNPAIHDNHSNHITT
jgi:hypothetical protein